MKHNPLLKLLSLICLSLFVLLPSPSITVSQDEDIDEDQEPVAFYIEEAQYAFDDSDYEESVDLIAEGLEYYPQNQELKKLSAKANWKTGSYDSALTTITDLLQADPKTQGLLWLQATILFETGKYPGSLASCEQILKNVPADTKARLLKAEILLKQGKREDADIILQWFDDFYNANEDLSADEYYACAKAYYFRRQWSDSSDTFDEAIKVNPKHIDSMLDQANLLLEKGNPTLASDRLRHAYKLQREDPKVLTYYAMFELSRNRQGNAKKHLRKALKVNPNYAPAHTVKGIMELTKQNYDDAITILQHAVELNPSDTEIYSLLAVCYYMNGQPEKFKEIETLVFKLNPKCADFYLTMGQLLLNRLIVLESSEFLKKALAIDPKNYAIHHSLGLAYMRLGEEEEGRRLLETANSNDPYDVSTFNYLELMDKMEARFETIRTEHLVIRLDRKEAKLMGPYLVYWCEKAYNVLQKKYDAKLDLPITVESFMDHSDFAVRGIGVPGIPALGICWGRFIATDSPMKTIPEKEHFVWANTMWHEMTHTMHLHMSKNRICRWLAEGNATYEQDKVFPSWDRDKDTELLAAYYRKSLPKISTFNDWFYDRRIGFAYYIGGVYNEFIAEEFGFEKLVELLNASESGHPILKLIEEVLGLSPEEYDKRFYAYVGQIAAKYKFAPVYSMVVVDELKLQALKNPNDVVIYAKLADAFSELGIDIDSEIALDKAKQLDPEHPQLIYAKAHIASRKDKNKLAVELYEKALALGIDNFQLRLFLGTHYYKEGHGPVASNEMPAANDAPPEAPNKEDVAMVTKAIAHLEKSVEYFPHYIHPRGALPILINYYKAKSNEEKMIYWMQQYVDIDATDIQKAKTIAAYYDKKGNTKEAIHYYWQAVMINPWHSEVHAPLAKLLYDSKDYERATLEYQSAMFFDVKNLDLAMALANCHMQMNNKNKAKEVLLDIMDRDPDHAAAKKLLDTFGD